MKRSSIFILIIIILILASLLTISIMNVEEMPIIKVKAEVTVTDGNPAVEIVNIEQDAVNPLKAPQGDSDVGFPSVDAKAIIATERGWAKVSYWDAEVYHGNGTYDFVLGFHRGITLEHGDMVRVSVDVVEVDDEGHTYKPASDMKIIIWE